MTFFSSTDNRTLLEQGKENNHFLSLIVNNAGNYTAAITRQMVSEYTINENRSYKSFGDRLIRSKNKSKGERMFIEKIMADITVEGRVDFTDRIKQIKDSKVKVIPTTSVTSNRSYQKTLFDDVDETIAKREYEKRGGWQHGYYQNYTPKSTVKSNKDILYDYKDSFEYDVVMDLLGTVDTLNPYKEIEQAEKCYDEMGITNAEFKETVIDSLNFYTANYNIDFNLMNKIVDCLPQNRITSTLKSIIADG